MNNNDLVKMIQAKFFSKGYSVVVDGTEGPCVFRVYEIGNQVCGPEIVHFTDVDKMIPWLNKQW